MKLTNNFADHEFFCECCGLQEMDINFMRNLQLARTIAGVPFHINSGWRCSRHNARVSNKPTTSSHLKGLAADIRARTMAKRLAIIEGLLKAGFVRIGMARTFIHADLDPDKQPVLGYIDSSGKWR